MKKTLLILVLSCFALTVTAQEEKQQFNTKKYQINIAVADIFVKNNWWFDLYYYDEYGNLFFYYNGAEYYRQPAMLIGFKYQCGKGALRMGLNFRYSQSELKGDDSPDEKYTFQNMGTGVNLGYEWHNTFGRVNVYYGVDGIYAKAKYKIRSEYDELPYKGYDELIVDENRFGISPLVGLNFFITPAFSIGTEIKFNAEYMLGTNTAKHYREGPYFVDDESKEERNGFRTYFGPLGFLSLNIHL